MSQEKTHRSPQHAFSIVLGTAVLLLMVLLLLSLNSQGSTKVPFYTYKVVNVYSHDPQAFTEGLVFQNGVLYEGTGLYGESSLRRVDLQTGKILQLHALSSDLFGEGITILGNEIIQLTWRSNKGFVYDKQTFNILREFSYPTEGWGITCNGSHLIMSDGSANLYFLDPATFELSGKIQIYDKSPVTGLNELEYVKGEILANVWTKNLIAKIDPNTGQVKGWIDLSGIQDFPTSDPDDVLNGIAYDAENDRILVTGKRWPKLFEIQIMLAH